MNRISHNNAYWISVHLPDGNRSSLFDNDQYCASIAADNDWIDERVLEKIQRDAQVSRTKCDV